MSVIVTDRGFQPEDFPDPIVAFEASGPDAVAVDVPNTIDPGALAPHFARLSLIRVAFPAFGDGRGFTLARRLRLMGYAGRLRAAGPLIADQYALARRAGFDEVEIPDALAARQPEAHWLARADWSVRDYRARLAGVSRGPGAV